MYELVNLAVGLIFWSIVGRGASAAYDAPA
jgi:hypothetical protein